MIISVFDYVSELILSWFSYKGIQSTLMDFTLTLMGVITIVLRFWFDETVV